MRDEYLLPENPVPPANCATSRTYRTREDGSAEEAMAAALREARAKLWGDLWQRVESQEKEITVLRQQLAVERARARRRKSRGATRRTTARVTSG